MKPDDPPLPPLPLNPGDSRPGRSTGAETPEPRRSGVFLGSFRGIRFYLDYSWFIIAALVGYLLSVGTFPALLAGRSPGVYLAMGVSAATLFFLSILLHELGHSIVSQRCNIPVPSITLLFIGGIAEISREPDTPGTELKIALAGPAVSLVLVAVYLALGWAAAAANFPEGSLVFRWLAQVNLVLVIFNAIPGYPLDGGRVLRALLWMRSGNLRKATYVTSRIGIGFSYFLIVMGVLALFAGGWNGIVLILIGIFLKNAAESGYSQALFKEALEGAKVSNIMTANPITIPARLPLNLAVDDYFLTNHHVAYPVVEEDGRFRGLLRLEFLKKVPREKWPFTLAGEIADLPESRSLRLDAEASAAEALRILLTTGQGRMGVTDREGHLVGIVTRHDLLHYIRIQHELGGTAGQPS